MFTDEELNRLTALCEPHDLAEDESPDDTVWECPSCKEYCGRESDEETPDDRLCAKCGFKRYDEFREVVPRLVAEIRRLRMCVGRDPVPMDVFQHMKDQRDAAHRQLMTLDRVTTERDELQSTVSAMRPVVDAAIAMRRKREYRPASPTEAAVCDAVDAYEATTKAQ